MRRPVLLCGVNTLNYLLLCLNFRAVAQGNIPRALVTDALLAALGFTIIKAIGNGSGWRELAGYVLGGLLGTTLALTFGLGLE